MKLPKIVRDLQNVTIPEINYGFQKNISYSQMSMYRKCPHQWATQYKEGNKRYSPSIHLVFGTSMHEAIQHYLDVMYDKSVAAADRIDLDEYFNEVYIREYKKSLKTNNNEHFSSPAEMREFYDDGITILDYFKSKRGAYFSKRKTHLVGCELPILMPPNPAFPNTLYMGYLDVVLYNENTDKFTIIDLKTSTRGWKDKDKKDEEKQYQLLLYKEFFSKQYENLDFAQKRIQSFKPAAGKIKLSRSHKAINEFINECFTTTGEYKERSFDKNPSKWNCGFCPFKEDAELCGAGAFL